VRATLSQPFKSRRFKRGLVATAAAAAIFAGGGAAQAVLTGHTAGGLVSLTAATQNNAWTLPAGGQGTWQAVPGMVRSVTVPSGTNRKLFASYYAESLCQGANWTYCSVRIVAINTAGGVIELHPQAGTDFSFDAPGNGTGQDWEAHSIKRTYLLGPGTYRVQVQATRMNGANVNTPTLRLDEQYFDAALHV
jgi:hypothetical protein